MLHWCNRERWRWMRRVNRERVHRTATGVHAWRVFGGAVSNAP